MTEVNATTIEEEEQTDQDVQTTEPGDPTEYTLNKQELDQERANARRARQKLASVSELYDSEKERASTLERELEELKSSNAAEKARLEAERQSEQDKLDEMDPDIVDPQVIKNIQAINRKLDTQRENFQKERQALLEKQEAMSKKISQYETERAEAQRKTDHEKAVESVLSRVEASLKLHNVTTPGQYRAEAMKLADDLVDKGQRERPQNTIQGIELMEECYMKVIAKNSKKKGVSVDPGKSGVTSGVRTTPERKTGSLDDVAADMLKDKSWKNED